LKGGRRRDSPAAGNRRDELPALWIWGKTGGVARRVCVYIEEWCGKAIACTTRGALRDGAR
jgi:hypothetical protein